MNWFANRGQILQVLLQALTLAVAAIVGWPKLKEVGFVSANAILFYVCVGLVVYLIGQIWSFVVRPKLAVVAKARFYSGITYPLKLHLVVTNIERDPVAIDSESFELANNLRLAPNAKLIPGTTNHRPRFLIWSTRDKDGKKVDEYADRCVLEPGREILAWVPIDPAIGETALTTAINAKAIGVWCYRCAWFGKRITASRYKHNL